MNTKNKTVERLPFAVIGLMKSVMNDEPSVEDKADVLLFDIGRELVNYRADKKPTVDLEYLYDIVSWLQSEIISKK